MTALHIIVTIFTVLCFIALVYFCVGGYRIAKQAQRSYEKGRAALGELTRMNEEFRVSR